MADTFEQPRSDGVSYYSAFHRLASLVQARDVAMPFAKVIAEGDDWTEQDLVEELIEAGALGQPVLCHGDRPRVFFCGPTVDSIAHVDIDYLMYRAEDIEPDEFMSADTSLLTALSLFAERGTDSWFVTVDGNEFSGVLSFGDFMKPAARVCWFAMILELEGAALALCSHFPQQSWESLPDGRQAKAKRTLTYRRFSRRDNVLLKALARYGDAAVYQLLLDCTTFIDKSKMICKCNLTGESHERIRSTFARAESLRNVCAHPAEVDDESPLAPGELLALVEDVHYLIDSFQRATPRVRVDGGS